MLEFDVYEPSFMGIDSNPRFGAHPRKHPQPAVDGYHYTIYVHGRAEDELHFDIPYLINGQMPITEGTYECVVGGKVGLVTMWDTNAKSDYTVFKGLVYYVDDHKAATYARRCAVERWGSL